MNSKTKELIFNLFSSYDNLDAEKVKRQAAIKYKVDAAAINKLYRQWRKNFLVPTVKVPIVPDQTKRVYNYKNKPNMFDLDINGRIDAIVAAQYKSKALTKEDILIAIKMLKDGEKSRAIAEALDVKVTVISNLLKKLRMYEIIELGDRRFNYKESSNIKLIATREIDDYGRITIPKSILKKIGYELYFEFVDQSLLLTTKENFNQAVIDKLNRIRVPKEFVKNIGYNKIIETRKLKLDIFTDDRNIVLKTHITKCVFCNNKNDLIEFYDKKICKKCRDNLKK